MLEKSTFRLYSSTQIRTIEQAAMAAGISGFQMMLRAGEAALEEILRRWPDAGSVAVFCGGGNNAGDGYVLARLLSMTGMQVTVYSVVEPKCLKNDALLAYQDFVKAEGRIKAFRAGEVVSVDVVIDALLGIGLSRPVSDSYAAAIQVINACLNPILSMDVPSGIDVDTGSVLGDAVQADCTITFVGMKQGLLTGAAPDYCGDIVLADLLLPEDLFSTIPAHIALVAHQPLPKRARTAHKGVNGHVLVVGGACGFSGAVMLAGHGALRVGSGLVSLATRHEHASLLSLNCPELMCHAVDTSEQILPLLAKASVVVVGPGLGQSQWAQNLLFAVLSSSKPLIMDADALNLLAHQEMRQGTRSNWILTPHPGEAARLLNISSAVVQQDRFAAARTLQARYGGVVVLKGAGTLIADAEQIHLSATGNPGMAGGGMGDVLAGVIAGLCAQGLNLQEAAQQGVYIHGASADQAAEAAGERGLLASDLLPYLRRWVN